MYSLKRHAVALCLAGLLALPAFASSPKGLVGMAQGTGPIQINGLRFEGQTSLFSGDRIVTGSKSLLTLISSPAERVRFQPGTSAEVAKDGSATVIRLNKGVIDFRTAGALRADLPNGVTVSPAESTTTLAEVNRLANGTAEVAVYKGTVEVANAENHVTVNAGHTAVIGPQAGSQNAQNQNNKKKKKLWAIFIAAGVNAGVVAAILANEKSSNISAVDP
jgi:hypothetical protein